MEIKKYKDMAAPYRTLYVTVFDQVSCPLITTRAMAVYVPGFICLPKTALPDESTGAHPRVSISVPVRL